MKNYLGPVFHVFSQTLQRYLTNPIVHQVTHFLCVSACVHVCVCPYLAVGLWPVSLVKHLQSAVCMYACVRESVCMCVRRGGGTGGSAS